MKHKLFMVPQPIHNPRVRLFCFPYAGGDASIFMNWTNAIPALVELVAIQPPGRSNRCDEKNHTSMESLIDELLKFSLYITQTPYIFLGHSLGSRVAFELTTQLEELGMRPPVHLIASGSRAPHSENIEDKISELPKHEFLDELKKLNGTPADFFEYPELIDLLIPMLKADFKIAETHRSTKKIISCPITVLGGYNDTGVSFMDLSEWGELSRSETKIIQIHGDHFFIVKNRLSVLKSLNTILNQYLATHAK